MSLRQRYLAQLWLGIFGGCCAVAAFVGCVLQAHLGVAVVNVFSFGLNAWVALDAWRGISPAPRPPRES